MVSAFTTCFLVVIGTLIGGALGITAATMIHVAAEENKEDMRKMEELERRMFDKADSTLFAPISQKLTAEDLVGKPVCVLRKLQNRGGEGVSPGTIATIKRVVRGQGITIETKKCPCCGQYAYITGVKRDDLTLVPEHKEDDNHANS